ncbi:hypothetical protein LEP1GSC066_2336 [Leptospira sp. serovar Kenya str. Sh9]|nr:hypothetical protein LEP1GSC066_2336 [Leptospira sp. serovar Kenya str. Sh9]
MTGAESPLQPLLTKSGFARTFLHRIHIIIEFNVSADSK